jgi:hypothetical protein
MGEGHAKVPEDTVLQTMQAVAEGMDIAPSIMPDMTATTGGLKSRTREETKSMRDRGTAGEWYRFEDVARKVALSVMIRDLHIDEDQEESFFSELEQADNSAEGMKALGTKKKRYLTKLRRETEATVQLTKGPMPHIERLRTKIKSSTGRSNRTKPLMKVMDQKTMKLVV